MAGPDQIAPPAPRLFKRDSFTLLAYGMLGYLSFLLTIPGPIMPFLRTEMNLNYTVASLHFSAFATGMILAGLSGDRITTRLGRQITFWGGAAGMATGGLGLALSRIIPLTLSSTLLMGLSCGILLVTIQASLSERHQNNRGIALMESNVVASFCAILAPLAVGIFEQTGLGWRVTLFLIAGLLALAFLRFRRERIPQNRPVAGAGSNLKKKLPGVFWIYWLVIFFSVATEWCMSYWSSDFLEKVGGLNKSTASLTLSLYFLAMMLGRIGGSWAIRHYGTTTLILLATGGAGIGFPLFWLVPVAPVRVVGLFIVGFGIANLYPLTLAAATGVTPGLEDKASARLSLGIGTAMLSAPLCLGWAADMINIQNAYVLVAGFLVMVALATAIAGNRASRPSRILAATGECK